MDIRVNKQKPFEQVADTNHDAIDNPSIGAHNEHPIDGIEKQAIHYIEQRTNDAIDQTNSDAIDDSSIGAFETFESDDERVTKHKPTKTISEFNSNPSFRSENLSDLDKLEKSFDTISVESEYKTENEGIHNFLFFLQTINNIEHKTSTPQQCTRPTNWTLDYDNTLSIIHNNTTHQGTIIAPSATNNINKIVELVETEKKTSSNKKDVNNICLNQKDEVSDLAEIKEKSLKHMAPTHITVNDTDVGVFLPFMKDPSPIPNRSVVMIENESSICERPHLKWDECVIFDAKFGINDDRIAITDT